MDDFAQVIKTSFLLVLLSVLLACNPDKPEPPASTLLDAAEQGDLVLMDDFLKGSQLVNMRNACQWTPLMKAALNGQYEAVVRLLEKGAEVDLVDKGGYSAMMLASSNNFSEIVELLIQHGAEVNHIEYSHHWSALLWASKLGHLETVKVLLKHQADISLADDQNKTALDYARQNGFQQIVALLEKE
jgi:uncharacterized protein